MLSPAARHPIGPRLAAPARRPVVARLVCCAAGVQAPSRSSVCPNATLIACPPSVLPCRSARPPSTPRLPRPDCPLTVRIPQSHARASTLCVPFPALSALSCAWSSARPLLHLYLCCAGLCLAVREITPWQKDHPSERGTNSSCTQLWAPQPLPPPLSVLRLRPSPTTAPAPSILEPWHPARPSAAPCTLR